MKNKWITLGQASSVDVEAAGLPVDFKVGSKAIKGSDAVVVSEFKTREEEFEAISKLGLKFQTGKQTKASDLDKKIREALR
jgi:hypothetical protein